MRGQAGALFAALSSEAYLFTLTPADVRLSEAHSEPSALYDHARMAVWRAAVSEAFQGPVFMVFEVGQGAEGKRGALHCHAVGHRQDGPQHLRRGSERCKAVYDPEGLLTYLHKPAEPYSLEAELDFRAAEVLSPNRKAPRTRGLLLGVSRLAWAESLMNYARNAQRSAPLPEPGPESNDPQQTQMTPELPEPKSDDCRQTQLTSAGQAWDRLQYRRAVLHPALKGQRAGRRTGTRTPAPKTGAWKARGPPLGLGPGRCIPSNPHSQKGQNHDQRAESR